jgi:hypothetical protein
MSVPSAALSSRRARFWLPWVSALVLVAGLVTFLIVYNVGGIRNTSKPVEARPATGPVQEPKELGPRVPLPKEARLVAARWIISAVGRTHLAESWQLSAPELKKGFTLAQWKTGEIPVVPYPVGKSVGGIVRVNWSTKKDVSFEVTLVPNKKGLGVKAQDFHINLRSVGTGNDKRWLVYYWGPRALPAIPDANETR